MSHDVAAGAADGAGAGADVSGLGLTGSLPLGAGADGRGALAMDAARAAEKVMARDGRYAAVDEDEMYF
jgi:hypothetical protein